MTEDIVRIPRNRFPIEHVIVLMLENRSYDHMLRYLSNGHGVSGHKFNLVDPSDATSERVRVSNTADYIMAVDPAHDFIGVEMELFGPAGRVVQPASWCVGDGPAGHAFQPLRRASTGTDLPGIVGPGLDPGPTARQDFGLLAKKLFCPHLLADVADNAQHTRLGLVCECRPAHLDVEG